MEKIKNIHKNIMGTLSFNGKFEGMRKEQEFIVYPIKKDDDAEKIKIQSDKRIGYIDLKNGDVILSNGKYSVNFLVDIKDRLSISELAGLKFRLFQTSGDNVGSNGVVVCDNSGVEKVSIF